MKSCRFALLLAVEGASAASRFNTAGTAETTCGNWTSTTGSVYFGRTDQSTNFFNSSSDCSATRRVLCLQQ